ncbi:MAG: hypothetical protein ACFFAS_01840 [Promethearchaeota archaeon]
MDLNNMPAICVRCKTNANIDVFEYRRTRFRRLFSRHKRHTQSVRVNIPVCKYCKLEFSKYKKYESAYDAIGRYLLLIFLASLVIFLSQYLYITFKPKDPPDPYDHLLKTEEVLIIISLIAGLISLTIFIVLLIVIKKHPNRISKYIKLSFPGNVSVIDEILIDKIDDKLSKDIENLQAGIDVITCPKCGKKYNKKYVDFCDICGKNLKGL